MNRRDSNTFFGTVAVAIITLSIVLFSFGMVQIMDDTIIDADLHKSYIIIVDNDRCWVIEKRTYLNNPSIYDATYHAGDLDSCVDHLKRLE